MSLTSTVNKLPVDVRLELKRRMRAGSYSILDLTVWLKESGYTISKSAIGRYSKHLQETDAKYGLDREIMAKQGADIVALFEELAHLKSREAEIIAMLKAATVFHKPSGQRPQ